MSALAERHAAAEAQRADHDAYRRAPYPAGLHPQLHPDRLAVVATLAGMAPPDIRTARVLDIGTGNGMNLLAMAVAYPDATFVGTDIVADGIETGREWAAKAGLNNVDLRIADLLDPDALTGEFDYITAHGVFAWVPPAVGEALLAAIARHLAPQGVALVSYNALPGSYIRMAMRDRMLAASEGLSDPDARLAAAREALKIIATGRYTDAPVQSAFRYHASEAIKGADNVLLHDEMGGCFRPRYQADAIAEGAAAGLKFLGDACPGNIADAFLPRGADLDGDHHSQVVRNATERDWNQVHSFHHTLFVRADAPVKRTLDLDRLGSLYVASSADETAPSEFVTQQGRAALQDDGLVAMMRHLVAQWPRRVPFADLGFADEAHQKAVFGLFDAGILTLHMLPEPYAADVGTDASGRPVASPLVRMMIREGFPWAATLDHRRMHFEPGAQQVLLALDGSGDEAALQAAASAAGLDTPAAIIGGIAALAQQAVFVR